MSGSHNPRRALETIDWSRVVRRLLLAAVAVPAWPFTFGEAVVAPFGLTARAVALVAVAGALAWAVWRLRTEGSCAARTVAVTLVSGAAVSLLFAAVVRWRANGFFSSTALVEGMTILLALHLIDARLRLSGRRVAVAGSDDEGDVDLLWSGPWQLADELVAAVAALLISFWVLAALKLHAVGAVVFVLASLASFMVVALRALAAVARWARGRSARSSGARGAGAA
jgi:hypothetical protein